MARPRRATNGLRLPHRAGATPTKEGRHASHVLASPAELHSPRFARPARPTCSLRARRTQPPGAVRLGASLPRRAAAYQRRAGLDRSRSCRSRLRFAAAPSRRPTVAVILRVVLFAESRAHVADFFLLGFYVRLRSLNARGNGVDFLFDFRRSETAALATARQGDHPHNDQQADHRSCSPDVVRCQPTERHSFPSVYRLNLCAADYLAPRYRSALQPELCRRRGRAYRRRRLRRWRRRRFRRRFGRRRRCRFGRWRRRRGRGRRRLGSSRASPWLALALE
jgi:hypothetical protein